MSVSMLDKVARAMHASHGILLPFDQLSDSVKDRIVYTCTRRN